MNWVRVVLVLLLSAVSASRAAAARVEAYSGQPFGVAVVTVDVATSEPVATLEDDRFTVESADGRALYPVVKQQPVRKLIRGVLGIESPATVTMYFLFRGDGPFDVQTYSPTGQVSHVAPAPNPRQHRRLLDEWWQAYAARWKDLRQTPQFPPVVDNFLAANLARRLGAKLPETDSGLLAWLTSKKSVWDELLPTEGHALATDQSLLAGGASTDNLLGPLPPPMPWYDVAPPAEGADKLADVAVEPIAAHVPVEAFYLRFGNFANYLWFRDLNKKWYGDLGNMLARRGIDRGDSDRLQQQLSLRENVLAKFLGPQVIADVAIIGLDPYMDQGAAIGVLFQAKNVKLLANDLNTQRREALTKFPEAKETTVKIADRDVSLISTPRGEVRSYYVEDGDFILVTTSKTLVARFLQASGGDRALAGSTGFRLSRQRLEANRGDAIFAYISPEFIRELTSPATWIESQRRIRSQREMKLISLARLEAAAEGVAATSVDQLVAASLLPAGFAAHGDASRLEEGKSGFTDSLRGEPGLFIPVSDMEVAGATAAETSAYRTFGDRFRQEVGQLPPIAIAVKRVPLADGSGETLVVEAAAAPLDGVKLGKLPDYLGEPSTQRVAALQGDLIRGEAVVNPILPILSSDSDPHHLFFAVRDGRVPLVVQRGKLAPGSTARDTMHVYWGAWPKAGLLKLFSGNAPADGPEPVPGANNTWQAKRDDFFLACFQSELVREVLPQLALAQVERPAQVWLDVADLTGTELSKTVNAVGYQRARETTLAACRLMNTLAAQLHAPRPQCRELAEQLMDGHFSCPLGGEYQLADVPGGKPLWTSTALAPQNRFELTEAPADFQLTALSWLKGLRGDARLDKQELSAHVEVDMAKSAIP